MKRIHCLLLAASLVLPGLARADERALQFLEDRYTHAFLHQVGDVAEGEPPALGRADCTGQRALSRTQRNRARQLGRIFERSGVHVDVIASSRWCGAIETASLLELRPVTEEALLNASADAIAADPVLDLIDGMRAKETALLVTHGANIRALTGLDSAPGEVIVFRLRPGSDIEIRGSFKVD